MGKKTHNTTKTQNKQKKKKPKQPNCCLLGLKIGLWRDYVSLCPWLKPLDHLTHLVPTAGPIHTDSSTSFLRGLEKLNLFC